MPSHPQALTKVKVNIEAKVNMWWDHAKGPKKGSQQSDYTRRRQEKTSPREDVAKKGRRPNKASSGKGVA